MTIIRKGSESQRGKETLEVSAAAMDLQAISCQGECYDCDGCGGSVTH